MVNAKFKVGGMDCSSCAATIEKAVRQVQGVSHAKANFAGASLEVEYDPRVAKPEDIRAKVGKAGYSLS